MTSTALILVLASAGLHATWNFLYKGARDKQAFSLLFGLSTLVLQRRAPAERSRTSWAYVPFTLGLLALVLAALGLSSF